MTLQSKVSILDPFTHKTQDREKIQNFDFIRETSLTETEKVRIEETFCTLVAVGGKYLEKKTFKKVLKMIDDIRRIIRIKIYQIFNYNYQTSCAPAMASS